MSRPILYGPAFSTYVRTCRVTLAEKGVDYDLEEIDILSGIPEGFLSAGDVAKVKDAIDAGAFMLDVRTEGEWTEGRIPGAYHINLRALGEQLQDVPKDRQVITYCKSGHRAALAMAALQVLGYENVKAFPASWKGWVDAGEAIEA